MRCIFCKTNSDSSKSVEHIIPESLGNTGNVLKRGLVCDNCNNYFAVKVESKVLESPYFKSLRHRNMILSKKKKLPSETGFVFHQDISKVQIVSYLDNIIEVQVPDSTVFELIAKGEIKELHVPIIPMPEEKDYYFSRLMAKMALEVMADRISKIENWNDEFVDHTDIDRLRNYARYGIGGFWPYTQRKVYNEHRTFINQRSDGEPTYFQVLHEYDYHVIDNVHLIFVCIIMGIEYSINVGDRNVELYLQWLANNGYESPLMRR